MRTRIGTVLLVVALATLVVGPATAGKKKRTLDPNPANDPALINEKLDPNRYDGADGCVRKVPQGTRKLKRWLKQNTKKRVYSGAIRCDGGVHGTGRALDFMLDARKKWEKRLAMKVINTWLARDANGRRNALARRMGVQLVIFNCRWWQAGDRGWSRYGACSGGRKNADPTQGHIDHIHVELTKPAAKLRTSFWRTELDGGGHSHQTGGVSP